jgi:homocysteine S-methyltransferase
LDAVLVCDGAMGTMLHSAGIPLGRCVSELNLTRPRLVRDLHAAYLAAGAQLLQTNTFDANRLRLTGAGMPDRVTEINIAGARLAREAVRDHDRTALVAGSVGPVRRAGESGPVSRADRAAALREQVAALADWVDVLLLETFGEIDAVVSAVEVARDECDVPIIAQMTFAEDGRTLRGEDPAEVASVVGALEVVAFGANCTVGPAVMLDVIAALAEGARLPIVVQPNAGTPRRLGRGLRYAHNTGYFAHAAVRLVAAGASIVGGCCGTTPGHIRAVAKAVAELAVPRKAGQRVRTMPRFSAPSDPRQPDPTPEDDPVGWPNLGRPIVLAGLRAPRDSDVPAYLETARVIASAGADMLAIVDPELSTSRISPVAAAVLLSERVRAPVVLPVEAAGRSLSALQADLLGAHAFGLRTVVCRTGAPRYAGDYPDPQSPSDVDSVRLIAALGALNDGVDWRGVPMPERTRFVIGASLSTSVADPRREVERVAAKARAGVHFLLTDVVYEASRARDMLMEIRALGVTVPVVVSVAPFRDARTIARLAHETPERHIPDAVLAAHEGGPGAGDKAAEVAEKLLGEVAGVLVHGPRDLDPQMVAVIERLAARCRTMPWSRTT